VPAATPTGRAVAAAPGRRVADEQLLRVVVQDEGLGRDAERDRTQDAPGRRIHDAYPAGSGAH